MFGQAVDAVICGKHESERCGVLLCGACNWRVSRIPVGEGNLPLHPMADEVVMLDSEHITYPKEAGRVFGWRVL